MQDILRETMSWYSWKRYHIIAILIVMGTIHTRKVMGAYLLLNAVLSLRHYGVWELAHGHCINTRTEREGTYKFNDCNRALSVNLAQYRVRTMFPVDPCQQNRENRTAEDIRYANQTLDKFGNDSIFTSLEQYLAENLISCYCCRKQVLWHETRRIDR